MRIYFLEFLPSFSPSVAVVAGAVAAVVVVVVRGVVALLPASAVGEDDSMTGVLSSSSTSLSDATIPPVVTKALRPLPTDVELKQKYEFCQFFCNVVPSCADNP